MFEVHQCTICKSPYEYTIAFRPAKEMLSNLIVYGRSKAIPLLILVSQLLLNCALISRFLADFKGSNPQDSRAEDDLATVNSTQIQDLGESSYLAGRSTSYLQTLDFITDHLPEETFSLASVIFSALGYIIQPSRLQLPSFTWL
mmetsp:Transcript_6819/g.10991  ORF Transcript_6819/g.10991 Transcript_6819/m.10991 type:complete len:144 (-) Transcript_6819:122-553(-)